MAENHLVRCSVKEHGGAGVSHVGGTNSNGTHWKMSVREAIAGIRSGKLRMYINVERGPNTHGVWLGVEQKDGREVLTPTGEGADPSALLHLPDCPS